VVQVVKLGGSVITCEDEPRVRGDAIERLAREAAGAGDELVVVHGGGSLAHPLAVEHGLADGIEDDAARDAFARVHAALRRLNLAVLDALREAGRPAATLGPLGQLSTNDGEPGGWNLLPTVRLLDQGLVPVLHGDLVLDTARDTTVLSGDAVAAELARFLEADRLVFALDQDGVHSHPPGHEDATRLDQPTPDELAAAQKRAREAADDASGGMAGKLDAAVRAVRAGTPVHLVDGLAEGRLAQALAGEGEGTVLVPGGPDT